MGNSRNTGYLQNTIKVADNGNISLMHGSTMLMQISSSGAITTTGVISGSNALSASFAETASFVNLAQTASFVANAQSASNAVTATTASFANAFTVAGNLTAQTLVVQTITSSVDFVTGSTRFGSIAANTHVFTGSVLISGSLNVNSGSFYVGSNNQIGVNTNSPESQFVVAAKTGNSASVEINLNNSGYGRIFAYNRSTTTAANLVLNDPGGNVGIGATTPLWTLDVRGTIGAMGAGSDGTLGDCIILGNAGYPATQNNRVRASTSAAGSSNYIVFETSNGTIGSYNTSQLVLRGNGNVGIGTSTPAAQLHLVSTGGSTRFRMEASNSTYSALLDFTSGSTPRWSIGIDNTQAYGKLENRILATDAIRFYDSNNNVVLVPSSGNVGIGTSSPGQRLSVLQNTEAWASSFLNSNGTESVGVYLAYGSGHGIAIDSTENDSKYIFKAMAGTGGGGGQGSVPVLYAQCDGKVGIGTSSPNHKLDVNGDINIPGTNRIVFNNEPGSWGITARTTTSTTNLGSQLKNIIICGGGGNEGLAITGVGQTAAMEIRNDGAVWVKGTLTKGGGSFRIDHPLPEKKDTHHLYHSFIEGPKADLIYRGKINLVNGTATVNIDEVSTMTEGTFELLTRDAQCFVNNLSGWDLVKGNITENTLTITSQNTESTDEISWMVVAERNDEWFRDSEMTDDNGNTIVEKLKPVIVTE